MKLRINYHLPVFLLVLFSFFFTEKLFAQFTAGHILVAGSRDARVYEFDPSYNLTSSWTHPSFGVNGQTFSNGPNGMVFDNQGNLVVAGRDSFCVFSSAGTVVDCYPKVIAQATENIIFDSNGNLYTTTATGGANQIHKYDQNYTFINTFSMPTGELTGITCDTLGNLFIASQTCGCIYIVNPVTFAQVDVITGISGRLEGLQIDHNGDLLVAQFFSGGSPGQVTRMNSFSPLVIQQTISNPGLLFPVPLTIDNAGNIYTADYENGGGTLPADLYTFSAGGATLAASLPSPIRGPFGIVVAGANLPCGAFRQIVPTLSQWGLILLGLSILSFGAIMLHKRKVTLSNEA